MVRAAGAALLAGLLAAALSLEARPKAAEPRLYVAPSAEGEVPRFDVIFRNPTARPLDIGFNYHCDFVYALWERGTQAPPAGRFVFPTVCPAVAMGATIPAQSQLTLFSRPANRGMLETLRGSSPAYQAEFHFRVFINPATEQKVLIFKAP